MDVILVVMGCLSENKNGEMPMHKQGWDDVVSPSYLEGLAEIENIRFEEKTKDDVHSIWLSYWWLSDIYACADRSIQDICIAWYD